MKQLREKITAMWNEAERRKLAGDPPLRVIGGAYIPCGYDVGAGLLPWLSDAEAEILHKDTQELVRKIRVHDSQAGQRLMAKIAARRAAA